MRMFKDGIRYKDVRIEIIRGGEHESANERIVKFMEQHDDEDVIDTELSTMHSGAGYSMYSVVKIIYGTLESNEGSVGV